MSRVLVVGGGIGGLALGAALGQRGVAADILELRDTHQVYGVGIIQPWNVLRALRSLGVADRCIDAGFPFDHWKVHDAQGNEVGVMRSEPLRGDGLPAVNGISRRHLHEILTAAALGAGAHIKLGTTLAGLEQEPGRVSVTLTDGSQSQYDLVVGFDGIRSAVRQRVFGHEHDPLYTGFAVWRFTTERPASMTEGGAYFDFTRGTKAGLVPLSSEQMYLFLVTREPAEVKDRSRFPEMLRERLASYGGLVGEVRARLKDPEAIVYGLIEEVTLRAPWHRGRVLLCGDAAHASAPHVAQGAAMAIEDALVLAELVAEEPRIDQVLEAFMRRRHRRCLAVQTAAHLQLLGEMRAHGLEVEAQTEYADLADATDYEQLLAQPI